MTAVTPPAGSARDRAAALGSPWNEGPGARAGGLVLDHAELIADVTRTGAERTAARRMGQAGR